MSRIETREHAMELLFQIGFRNDPISNQIETFKENFPEVIDDEAYFLDIVYGVINSRDELDEKFVPFLKNWKLERLPQTASFSKSQYMRSSLLRRSLHPYPSMRQSSLPRSMERIIHHHTSTAY